MKRLEHFSIPILGLKDGVHQFDFKMDDEVFSCFDYGMLKQGKFDIKVILERVANNIEFSFKASGYMSTSCDRCTTTIHLPLKANEEYVIEFGEEESFEEKVITILINAHHFNVAKYIFESLNLRIPMVKLIEDCESSENRPCDEDILNVLNKEVESEKGNSIWSSLKDINFKK